MMCAFMTPVLKSDWEVYESNKSTDPQANPNIRLTGSSSDLTPQQIRQLQLQRLREIRKAKKQILLGARSQSYTAPPTARDSHHALLTQPRSYHLSTNPSRASLPVSPLAVERGRSRSKKNASSSSLNSFHNKVLDKLKNVLHIGGKDDDTGEEATPNLSGRASPVEGTKAHSRSASGEQNTESSATQPPHDFDSRRIRRTSRTSSFEIPNIAEEVVDSNGALVAA